MSILVFLKKLCAYNFCALKYCIAAAAASFVKNKPKYKDLWLISERGTDARDNGYYFFNYTVKNHPEINAAYVISKKSPDRCRVEKTGRIINHGSLEHYIAFILSKVKISTHIMGYSPYIDFFVHADKHGLVKGKKIFLQHGIIKDNLTYLHSDNVKTDLFVCSATAEYNYVKSLYGHKDGIVKMLGLCRYDELYKTEKPTRKILVMPTWRHNLRGVEKKQFIKSEYYEKFQSLLSSAELLKILEEYNYELLFYPHIEIQPFIDCFKGNERVKPVSFRESTVQSLLINSDILITDFSSVFFDYAYMEKPMVFYQFDEENFRKQHYREGYFDYRKDGFGVVVCEEKELLREIERILKNGAVTDDLYKKRVNEFFTIRDKKNCERNFEAVKEMVY